MGLRKEKGEIYNYIYDEENKSYTLMSKPKRGYDTDIESVTSVNDEKNVDNDTSDGVVGEEVKKNPLLEQCKALI